MEYKTIAKRAEARYIEKKSEFIGTLAPVSTEEQAAEILEEIRAANRKARHNCYAYVLKNGAAKRSDDGEPQGTAGEPIFEVLQKEGLTDVICVVTRYFGGILLGAGGLVRAYTKAASDAVKNAKIRLMAHAAKVELVTDYTLYGALPRIFAEFGAKTVSEEFADSVKIILYIRSEQAEALYEKLRDLSHGSAKIEILAREYFDFA